MSDLHRMMLEYRPKVSSLELRQHQVETYDDVFAPRWVSVWAEQPEFVEWRSLIGDLPQSNSDMLLAAVQLEGHPVCEMIVALVPKPILSASNLPRNQVIR